MKEITKRKLRNTLKINQMNQINLELITEKLEKKNKRVMNDRYRQIEKTGEYYRITAMGKGGKSFIFEVLN